MKADLEDLIGFSNRAALDEFLNSAALNYFGFSQISSLHHRLYGVISTVTDNDESREDLKSFIVNGCVKSSVWRTLQAVQADLESHLGFNLSPRFHSIEIPLPLSPKFTLPHPAVSAVNVQRVWVDIDTLDNSSVSPYIINPATMILNGGTHSAQVPATLVKNPDLVFLRDPVTHAAYRVNRDLAGYPNRVGANWHIPIHQAATPYDGVSPVGVQDPSICLVTVTLPTIPAGATAEPVYADTHQIIPYRSRISNGGNSYTYELYTYALVDPEFNNAPIDLVKGDFYKLMPAIDFAYWYAAPAYVELYVTDDCGETRTYKYNPSDLTVISYPEIRLVNSAVGVVQLCTDRIDFSDCQSFVSHFCPGVHVKSATIKIYYATDPKLLPPNFSPQISGAVQAGYAKAAADLPIKDCNCKITVGYISTMQMAYGTEYVNPTTQVQIFKSEYGQLHGQVLYKNAVDRMRLYRRPVMFSPTKGV